MRVVLLTRTVAYVVNAGATKTVSLRLSQDGRALASSRRATRVRVVAAPTTGAAVDRLLYLRR